jgi:CDP-glucose 4,6-dehydratase
MCWQDRRVFISGSTGFVGSWLLRDLIKKGADVTILVRDASSLAFQRVLLSKRLSVVIGSLEDSELVERIIADHEIEICFHLAARTLVYSVGKNPLSTFSSNIAGTWNLLEACRKSNSLTGFVFASSAKVYGVQKVLPIREGCQLLAKSPFGVSKVCAELLVNAYYGTYGLPVAISRFSNIYGGGDLNFLRVVPSAVRSVLLNRNPVIRSDGSPVRDYLYISDAVDAYLMLADSIEKTAVKGESFNFGSLNPMSILQVVKKIIEISCRKNLDPIISRKATPEIPEQYLSSEKARRILNWSDKFSIEEGLKETIRWFDENKLLWLNKT